MYQIHCILYSICSLLTKNISKLMWLKWQRINCIDFILTLTVKKNLMYLSFVYFVCVCLFFLFFVLTFFSIHFVSYIDFIFFLFSFVVCCYLLSITHFFISTLIQLRNHNIMLKYMYCANCIHETDIYSIKPQVSIGKHLLLRAFHNSAYSIKIFVIFI